MIPPEARLYPNDVDLMMSLAVKAEVPQLPPELIGPLERMVELAESKAVAEQIEAILRESQILDARTRKFGSGDRITILELGGRVIDAAALHARAASLFAFARRQTDVFELDDLWPSVATALSIFGIHDSWIMAIADDQRGRGVLPGEANTWPLV